MVSLGEKISIMAIEDSNCPYVVSDVPGAGRGLIATRDIKKGITIRFSKYMQVYFQVN